MSGQVKRSRVLAAQRHRKAVAREIAGRVELYWYTGDICQSLGWGDAADAILGEYAGRLNAVTFDVHAAREHAKGLVAMTRHEGVARGVDDHRQRIGRPTNSRIPHVRLTSGPAPGLPPGLARNAMNWRGLARLGQRILDMLEGQPSECQKCKGAGVHTQRSLMSIDGAPMRLGAASSWCPDCQGTGHNLRGYLPPLEWSPAVRRKASDAVSAMMRRTVPTPPTQWWEEPMEAARVAGFQLTRWDHTLGMEVARNYIDPVGEAGEADERAAMWESMGYRVTRTMVGTSIRRELVIAAVPGSGASVRDARTRITPRGQHRNPHDPPMGFSGVIADIEANGHRAVDHVRVRGYGRYRWAPRSSLKSRRARGLGAVDLMPRWRRGELGHARHRQATIDVVEGGEPDDVEQNLRNLHRTP